jgi:hypothetical protein
MDLAAAPVERRGPLRGSGCVRAATATEAATHFDRNPTSHVPVRANWAARGLRPRQRAAVLLGTTAAVALVATVIGVPLGLASGSAVWRRVADDAGLAADAVFSAAIIGLTVATALALALVVSAPLVLSAPRHRHVAKPDVA